MTIAGTYGVTSYHMSGAYTPRTAQLLWGQILRLFSINYKSGPDKYPKSSSLCYYFRVVVLRLTHTFLPLFRCDVPCPLFRFNVPPPVPFLPEHGSAVLVPDLRAAPQVRAAGPRVCVAGDGVTTTSLNLCSPLLCPRMDERCVLYRVMFTPEDVAHARARELARSRRFHAVCLVPAMVRVPLPDRQGGAGTRMDPSKLFVILSGRPI